MKMFIKSSLVVVIASAAMISCIDNTVAPEVQQARAAQVNYLNAVTAYQTAQADHEKAQADYQVLLNANQSTANSVAAANAEATMKQAEIALATATQGLAAYLATHKMDVANTYVTGYNTATGQIATLLGQKATKASDIARAKMLLSGGGVSFDLLKEEYQRDLDAATALLAVQQAGLVSLQAVVSTPTKAEAQTQLDAVNAQLLALDNEAKGFDVEESNLDKAFNEADKKVNDAEDVISDFDSWTSSLVSVNANITSQTQVVANAQSDLTVANGDLAAKKTILTNSTNAFNAQLAIYNTKKTAHDNAVNALAIANARVTIAQNNDNANSTTATQAELSAANTAQAAAVTAESDAQTALTTATNNKSTAEGQVNTAQNDVDNAQSNADNAQVNLTNQQTSLSNLNVQKADLEARLDASATAHTDAVANLEQLKKDLDTADRAYDVLNDKQSANSAAQNDLFNIKSNLENYVSTGSGIDQAIEDQKDAIQNTKEDVGFAQQALADNDIDKTEAQALVTKLEDDLDVIDAKIDAQTAIADKFKALLTAELGS